MTYLRFIIVTLLLLLLPLPLLAASAENGTAQVSAAVEAALQTEEKVRVIVALRTPQVRSQAALAVSIAQTQGRIENEIPADDFEVVHRYQQLPGMSGEVTLDGLAELRSNPSVAAVDLDLPVSIALESSRELIRASQAVATFGLTGAGVNVAVLDTGVDAPHPDLADNLIAEYCFNQGTCLPDQTDESDSAQDEQGHGTHVAGIISSQGTESPLGIAPDANIIGVRVLNRFGSGWTSDVIKGIEWVVANQETYNIRVMNLSLGGGGYDNNCDNLNANTQLYATAINAARQAGIVVFAASGNEGNPTQMMAPACVSSAIAVGNVHDTAVESFNWPVCTDVDIVAGEVTCSSNSSPGLDLLAPGVSILATQLGGGEVTLSGTSMSTPHVSGIAALLLEADPTLTPDEIINILKRTGVPTVDSRNGQATPRVDAFAAVSEVAPLVEPAPIISGTVTLQGRQVYGGVEVFVSLDACETATFGDPIAMTDETGQFTISPTGSLTETDTPTDTLTVASANVTTTTTTYQCLQVSTERYLVGQFANPQGNLGTLDLLAGDINADNTIDILDIAAIAGDYGSDSAASDLNVDSTVDIFDLSLAAKNYQMQGPLVEWE